MARKLSIPKAPQIRGIRKALANPKTPKQFRAGLRKRLARLLACILFALIASGVRAQTPVTIQPTQQILANSILGNNTCTGTQQTFPVNNRNQTQHTANFVGTGVTNLLMQIQGIDSSGNVFVLSDTATTAVVLNAVNPALSGTGYYPTVRVVVTCSPNTATFVLSYSASSATSGQPDVGSYQITRQNKTISSNAAASGSTNVTYPTPYGNSYGAMYFTFVGTGPAGSSISVFCETQNGTQSNDPYNFNLVFTYNVVTTNGKVQYFPVPSMPCPQTQVNYNSGGASANTYDFDYVYLPPGTSNVNQYAHVTGTTATAIKVGAGVVHSLTIGTPAAGTVSLFDLASASCTATPSTNTVSVVTATTTFPSASLVYDVLFEQGICLKASAAMDIAVSYQ